MLSYAAETPERHLTMRPSRLAWFILPALALACTAGNEPVRAQGLEVTAQQKISDTAGGFAGILEDDHRLGSSLTSVGDLDGDGQPEFAAGIRFHDDGGPNHGAVWILFLGPDGAVRGERRISDVTGGFSGVLHDGDLFGHSVAGLGDLDGDGVGDLAVGAIGDDDGAASAGAVWVLFLSQDGSVRSYQKISATSGGFGGNLPSGSEFGSSLASLGDVDGDQVTDLAVGAIGDDDGGVDRGAVWVLQLRPDGTVAFQRKISDTRGGFSGPLRNNDVFGSSVAGPGDIDGDGVRDLVVGAAGDDDGGPNRGALWVLFLQSDARVRSQAKISSLSGSFPGPLYDGGFLGWSLASLRGLERPTLAAGLPFDDEAGTNRGAAWILCLDSSGGVRAQTRIAEDRGGFTGPLRDGDQFGSSVAAVGPADLEGALALGLGAPRDDDGGHDRGAIWTVFLQADTTSTGVGEVGLPSPDPSPSAGRRPLLHPNLPNPFRSATRIRFSTSESAMVRLRILDVAGRQVRAYRLGDLPPGEHEVAWNGLDEEGRSTPSGIYYVRLETGGAVSVRRMVRMR